ncbi:HupE/UreJ family protein [Paraburkholderia sp. BR10954]|uniref:HupE/UreJ family protein n=1 Tax=Paraburkholderia sp. BR10954 TaxID=3236995 RepID=UPI0034D2FE69
MHTLHRLVRPAACGLILLLFVVSAEAHAVYQGAGDFYGGMLHPLTSPEHVLPMLALGVLAGQNGLKRCEFVLWAFPAALAAGASIALSIPDLHGIFLFNIASAVLLGSLVAAAFALPSWLILVLAAVFGLTHGYANGSVIMGQIRPGNFIAGLVFASFILMAYTVAATSFLLRLRPTWIAVAVRVAGSWTAAIGLLVLSFSQRALLLS